MASQNAKPRQTSCFWRTVIILCVVLACGILVGVGGLYLYRENQSLVSGTSTSEAVYGPVTATAASRMLTQAPSDPAIRAPDCAKMWASYDGLAPADQPAYLSSLAGKWIFNWRTRIVTTLSIPHVMDFGGYVTLITRTDDDCSPSVDVSEATNATLHAQQYIRVSGQITNVKIVAGSLSFNIDLTTGRVTP